MQLLKSDQDILHNIFCLASPCLFKFLNMGVGVLRIGKSNLLQHTIHLPGKKLESFKGRGSRAKTVSPSGALPFLLCGFLSSRHLGTHCLQLRKSDQDILHNIFCFASPCLFKLLCPGGWPVKDWTAHLAATSPSQFQTSRGNSHLSDSGRESSS